MGAYMFFCADKRPAVMKAHSDWKITQVASELGAMWKKVNEKVIFCRNFFIIN